jgi:glycosyltransferase involved in cell wall biosynthesis
MKILAIYFQSGSGISIIYERLFTHLAKSGITVDVLSDHTPKPHLEGIVRTQYYRPYSDKMQHWYRRCLRWFGTTPVSTHWTRRVIPTLATDYDVVVAFTASSQLTPVVAGRMIATHLGCKFAVYSVDAIPAPGGWTKRDEFRGKMRILRRNLPYADYVASSNSKMLEYQLTTFKNKRGLRTGVLLTPSPDEEYNLPISQERLILYTGTLYGLRNPDHILKAFKRLLKVYPDAQFMLVGVKMHLGNRATILTPEEREHVHTAGHTTNLEPLFRRAMVLVDIDADKEGDPFLSSKIVTYIKTNRVILCETGRHSASRELFSGLRTIIQCDHNEDSLYEGLLTAFSLASEEQDYSERKEVIERFSIDRVATQLRRDLEELTSVKGD